LCISHEIDGELTYRDEEDELSADASVQHSTVSDVTAVEGVCNDLGFVMCANHESR